MQSRRRHGRNRRQQTIVSPTSIVVFFRTYPDAPLSVQICIAAPEPSCVVGHRGAGGCVWLRLHERCSTAPVVDAEYGGAAASAAGPGAHRHRLDAVRARHVLVWLHGQLARRQLVLALRRGAGPGATGAAAAVLVGLSRASAEGLRAAQLLGDLAAAHARQQPAAHQHVVGLASPHQRLLSHSMHRASSFNLQIPRYESFEQLSERFDVVLESGFVGYDMA